MKSCMMMGGGSPLNFLVRSGTPFSGLFAVPHCPPGPHTTTRSPAPRFERAWRGKGKPLLGAGGGNLPLGGGGMYYITRGAGGGGFMVWVMVVHKSLMSDV